MRYSQFTQHSTHTVVNTPRVLLQVEHNFSIASPPLLPTLFFIGEGVARLRVDGVHKIELIDYLGRGLRQLSSKKGSKRVKKWGHLRFIKIHLTCGHNFQNNQFTEA